MHFGWQLIVMVVVALASVWEAESAVVLAPVARLQESAVPGGEVAEEEEPPPPPLAVPPGYQYDPRGRRDPFVNPVPPAVEAAPVIPVERPLGLPGVLLNEARLIGVVTSPEPSMNVVVVEAPGNRVFFARVGDELFDAVITQIDTDAISFEVKPLEGSSEPSPPEEVVRRLSTTPGE